MHGRSIQGQFRSRIIRESFTSAKMCCENVCMVVVKPFGMRYSLGLLPLAVSGSNERKRRCPAAAEPKITSPSLHMRSGGRNATGRGSIFTLFMFRVIWSFHGHSVSLLATYQPFRPLFLIAAPSRTFGGNTVAFSLHPPNTMAAILFQQMCSFPFTRFLCHSLFRQRTCCDCCAQKEFLTDWYHVDKEMHSLLTLPHLALFLRTHVRFIQL